MESVGDNGWKILSSQHPIDMTFEVEYGGKTREITVPLTTINTEV